MAGTTTRVLETELGVRQSSLYNDFGSKAGLVDQAVVRYESALEAAVLRHLDNPGRSGLLAFVDALVKWVGDDEHRGCLVLNLAAEDPRHESRMDGYRSRLRTSIGACLGEIDPTADVPTRTELLVAAVLGLSLAARTGASADELQATAEAIKAHVSEW